jgi:hypothetical protein
MRYYAAICGGLVMSLVVLEVFFRLLPVNSTLGKVNTSAAEPYNRYAPNQKFVYSHGWAFDNPTRGVTNREGFVNTRDFDSKNGVLVVGDSFMEAIMLPYQDTLQGQLDQALHGNVHSAASAGNRLPDTLALVRYFNQILAPQTVIIFIKTNELSNLLVPAKNGYNGFTDSNHQIALVHSPYKESTSRQLGHKSAFARYIFYNLKFPQWLSAAWPLHSASEQIEPISNAEKSEILEYYFSEMHKTLNASRVIFLIDGDRDAIYHNRIDSKTQAESEDMTLFSRMAAEHGFDVVDMHPVFEQHWSTYHERMDFLPIDGHWNPVAQRLAAEAILKKLHDDSKAYPDEIH